MSGNRVSGAWGLRFGVHSRGIGAEIDMLDRARIWTGKGAPLVVTGAALAGSDDEQDYEGALHIHRDFAAAIAEGRQAQTSFAECLVTMRLVEALEGGPYSAADRAGRREAVATT